MVGIYPAVIIGVGGTGYEVVEQLKKSFRETYGEVPIVRFLVFDTEGRASPPEGYRHLGVANAEFVVRNIDSDEHLKDWFPADRIRPEEAQGMENGADIRGLGRLALFWNVRDIKTSIDFAIQQAASLVNITKTEREFGVTVYNLENNILKVYIIGSLCGGTGSALLSDIAYLIRNHPGDIMIVGVGALPSVFEDDVTGRLMLGIKGNTYQTLKELDYFMDNQEFKCTYSGAINVDVKGKKPFDYFHIIDSWEENENFNVYRGATFRMIAKAVEIDIATEIPDAQDAMMRHVDINTLPKKFKEYPTAYSSFGLSLLVFPAEEIADLYASRLSLSIIDKILEEGFTIENVKKAVDEFRPKSKISSLKSDDIFKYIKTEIGKIEGIFSELDVEPYNSLIGRIETRIKDADKKLEDIYAFIDRITGGIDEDARNNLKMKIREITQKPHYAERFLDELNTEIESNLDDVKDAISKSEGEINVIENNTGVLRSELDTAAKARKPIFDPLIGGKKEKVEREKERYVEAIIKLFASKIDFYKWKKMEDFYNTMSGAVGELKGVVKSKKDNLKDLRNEYSKKEIAKKKKLEKGSDFILEIWVGTENENMYRFYNYEDKSEIERAKDSFLGDKFIYEADIGNLGKSLIKFSSDRFRDVREMSIAELFDELGDEYAKDKIRDLIRRGSIFLRRGAIAGWRPDSLDEIKLLGMANINEGIRENIQNAIRGAVGFVEMADKHSMIFTLYKYGYLLPVLSNIRDYKVSYEGMKDQIAFSKDKNLDGKLRDLII